MSKKTTKATEKATAATAAKAEKAARVAELRAQLAALDAEEAATPTPAAPAKAPAKAKAALTPEAISERIAATAAALLSSRGLDENTVIHVWGVTKVARAAGVTKDSEGLAEVMLRKPESFGLGGVEKFEGSLPVKFAIALVAKAVSHGFLEVAGDTSIYEREVTLNGVTKSLPQVSNVWLPGHGPASQATPKAKAADKAAVDIFSTLGF